MSFGVCYVWITVHMYSMYMLTVCKVNTCFCGGRWRLKWELFNQTLLWYNRKTFWFSILRGAQALFTYCCALNDDRLIIFINNIWWLEAVSFAYKNMTVKKTKNNKESHGLAFMLSKVRYERFLRIYKIDNKRWGFCLGARIRGEGQGSRVM